MSERLKSKVSDMFERVVKKYRTKLIGLVEMKFFLR